jgi:hypothetical protein
MTGELVLDCAPHQLQEAVFFFVLAQLVLELRGEQIKQLCVARNEWLCRVRSFEHHDIPWRSHHDLAAETALDLASVGTLLHILHPQWVERASASMASQRSHPGEAIVGQRPWLVVHSEKPAETDGKLFAVEVDKDFLRSRQLLVPSHVLGRRDEVLRR